METRREIVGDYKQPVMVRVDSLIIDDGQGKKAYQRSEESEFLTWEWQLYDPIRVADRNGDGKHVVDGGRRVRNARLFEIAELPAFIVDSRGPVDEAKGFTAAASSRKPLQARDRYKANVVAGDAQAVALYDVLVKHGLRIGPGKDWPTVRVVTGLLRSAPEAVDFALGIVTELWRGNSDALREQVLLGLTQFWLKHKDEGIDRSKLCKKLRTVDPILLVQRSTALAATTQYRRGIYGDVVEEYYRKRR